MSTLGADGLPLVDFSLGDHGGDGRRQRADELVTAFSEYGFAYLTNHGVPASSFDGVFTAARELFGAPAAVHNAVHYRRSRWYRGLVPLGDPDAPSGLKESYDCGLELPDTYSGPGAQLGTSPNLWPPMPGFRPAVETYFAHMRRLADDVLEAIAMGLHWPADHFRVRCRQPVAQLRLLHYPPAAGAEGDAYGAGAHSDYEALTILAQDSVGGLQIRLPDGTFMDVTPIPDALVLNVGEMMTLWTNGLMAATPHRVLLSEEKDRYSVAFFYATDYDVLIEPQPLSGSADDASYSPSFTGDYLQTRLLEVGG
jgi:isopenicillin N synthase-like dioxygenase